MLSKNNFLSNADVFTRRSAYLTVLKLAKLAFVTVGYAIVGVVAGQYNASNSNSNSTSGETGVGPGSSSSSSMSSGGVSVSASTHTQALVLQEALHHIPNPASDCMVRNVAARLAQSLHDQVTGVVPDM